MANPATMPKDTATPPAGDGFFAAPLASQTSSQAPAKKPTLKEKWQKLKEEDKQRKERSITYISEQDATKITGYGQDGGPKTRDEEKNGYKKTGVGKVFRAFLAL